MVRPSGTVTFLFTDIEGSTRRWEADPEEMRSALTVHDAVLRAATEAHGGWMFKHTGDGVCAAFGSARGAVDAAVEAQRRLVLPVRMGIATGSAELRTEDYFGPALNRAARVMAAGHGGQILLAAASAALLPGDALVDLGEHRLRDLSRAEHLFQVQAEGVRAEFPPLRTLDATPGNLPAQATRLLGRERDLRSLSELLRVHRLVTLTGVGGVGKTRLALQAAAELAPDFPDGLWLVELAPVGDPSAVAAAVAAALRVVPRAGLSVADSIASSLAARRLLIVLDNCEHVLDAAADLVETVLAHSLTVKVIATSREGLRATGEQLWPVPSLDVSDGVGSAAVELFVERARAVNPGFELGGQARADAVVKICQRLDGIALAIELAAGRMVSMSPQDVADRLGDRFRLLAGPRRGLERHQTLRHAVGWSYDLLDDDERLVLGQCSVFADGFDVAAAAALCSELDEYAVLDILDSLVRRSLLTAGQAEDHVRYGMLETIRQFAEEALAARGGIDPVRDRHARYFAEQVVVHWEIWDGPRQREALDWVEAEFANLRIGFRWAADHGDLATAATIAAHTTLLAGPDLARYEPSGWAEELLEPATAADLVQLPRLYTAAGFCSMTGRVEEGVAYAHTAIALEADPRYEPFEVGWSGLMEANGHRFAGRIDRQLAIYERLASQSGLAHVLGVCGMLYALPLVGRGEEAKANAEETVAAARAHGTPNWVAWAFDGSGRAFTDTDPARALAVLRQGLTYARDHRLPYWEANIARDAARLEAVHGELVEALSLFDVTIDVLHRAGNVASLAATLADVAVVMDRIGRADVAATLYGVTTAHASANRVENLRIVAARLTRTLGGSVFDHHVATGASMEPAEAMQYARDGIQIARRELADGRRPNPAR